MNYTRQYVSHAASTVATAIVTGALFYVLRIVLAHYLTFDQYGLFYAVFSFAAVFQPLLSFGFDPGLTPFVTRYRELHQPSRIRNLLFSALIPQLAVAAIFVALIYAVAPVLSAKYFGNTQAVSLLHWMAVHAAVLVFFKAGHQLLNGLQSVGARNLSECVRVVACLGVAGALVRSGQGASAAALAYVAGAAAGVLAQGVAAAVLHPRIVFARPRWESSLVGEAFQSGKYLSWAFSGLLLFSHLDTLLLTALLRDLNEVAAYQIAVPTWMIVQSLLIAASLSFMPMAKTLWLRGEHARLANGLTTIYHVAVIVLLPGGMILGSFSDVLIGMLFRRDTGSAPLAFYVLSVGALPFFAAYFNLHVLAGIGREKAAAVAVTLGLLVNVLLNLALVPEFGVRGAAAGTVMGYAVAAWIGYAAVMRNMSARLSSNLMAASLVVTLIVDMSCRWVRQSHWFEMHPAATAAAAGAVLLVASLTVLDRISGGTLVSTCRQLRSKTG
ncbi:MAG: hypothetical protein AMXMBFR84_41000 [Candidatus Hydrogenedentota bacterium]